MKFLPSFAVLAVFSVIVAASHDGFSQVRHNKLARRATSSGRCKANPSAAAPSSWSSSTHTSSTWSSSSYIPAPSKAAASNNNPPSGNSQSNGSSNNGNIISNIISGLINVQPSSCGPSGATKTITATSGPNGDIEWMNCGINTQTGWSPPYVTINDIVTVDLNVALQQAGTPFSACANYVWAFYQYGAEFGIPAIILASFAMQESSCNANTVGGSQEQGLMQITLDKCGGAPGGDCRDVNYNVRTGAKYFADTLSANNGDLLLTIGAYNGWHNGMTYGDATAARYTHCLAQNNLDYLVQFLNGWVLNHDAYTNHLGLYFNLAPCY